MEVKIYKRNGEVALSAIVDDSSQWNHEVGVENVVTLNFTTWEFVVLEAGARIEIAGEVFKLKSEYRPKHINNSKYSYSVQFHGREHDTEELLFCRLNQGEEDLESVFQYEGTPAELLAKVVENLNRNTDGVTWEAGEAIVAPRQSMNFNGVYCWEALAQIAETFKTEWWRDGNKVNLTKCEHGEEITLGYGAGLKSGIEQQRADNAVGFYTRLLPIGSTMNIDKEAYGHERLQLPGGVKYIDVDIDKGLKEHREEAAFSGIYPHRVGTVSMVEMEEKKDEEHGDYTVYYFADKELPFDPEECLLPDKVINVRFTTGELTGKDFEVNWQKNSERFEIINKYPDEESQLPGGNLIPEVGDKYVLWNLAMPVQYYAAAEEEFKQAVDDFIAESKVDNAVYTAPTDYVYLDRKGAALSVGRRVKLVSDRYFDEGAKSTRITKISRKLKRLNDATIECRSAVVKSWKSSVDSSISSISYSIANELEAVMLDVLQVGEKDAPTDYNVFSALRSLSTLLRKDKEDSTAFYTRFLAGIQAGLSKIYEDGGAELTRLDVLGKAAFNDDLSSSKYVSGMANGQGWAIQQKTTTNAAGEQELYTSAEVDELIVRKSLKIFEFVVSQLVGENDNRVFAGMMEVAAYDEATGVVSLKTDNGKLYNTFRPGDVLRVQQYSRGLEMKSYELVVATATVGSLADGENRLDAITFEQFVGGDPAEMIAEGDTLVRIDSVSDETRKGLIQVSSVGANAPYIDVVRGLKTDPENALKARIGNLDGLHDDDFGADQPQGSGVYAENCYLKGSFVLKNGGDVATELSVKDGMIKSAVQSLQKDEMSGKSVLYNPSFTEGLTGWQTENVAEFYLLGGMPVFAGESALRSFVEVVANDEYGDSRFFLSMGRTTIRQMNVFFEGIEGCDEDINTDVVFGLRYRTAESAMLIVAMEACDDVSVNACRGTWTGTSVGVNESFAILTAWNSAIEFHTIDTRINSGDVLIVTNGYRLINQTQGVEVKYANWSDPKNADVWLGEGVNLIAAEMLSAKENFHDYSTEGRWNGSGNLAITYTGEIDFYGVQLYSEPTELRYATLFEQTDKLVRFAAEKIDEQGNTLNGSEVKVTADGTFLNVVYQDNGEKKEQTLGEFKTETDDEGNTKTKVKLSGDNIELDGAISANGKVKIIDGKLSAIDGEFEGNIKAKSGEIGAFEIDEGLKYTENNDKYRAEFNENGIELGGSSEAYSGITDRSKKIVFNGRFRNRGDAQILRCIRTLPQNFEDPLNPTFDEYEPLVEIVDDSTRPTPALGIKGGMVLEGAFLLKLAKMNLATESSESELRINNGTRWVVMNSYKSGAYVYLPKRIDILKMLCLSNAEDTSFAIPMSVTQLSASKLIYLQFQDSDAEGFVNWDKEKYDANYPAISSKETLEFILVNDMEKGYYAILTNVGKGI